MRRTGTFLLIVCAVLTLGSAAAGLAGAASSAVYERFDALKPVQTLTPSFFVYLPLVTNKTESGSWVPIAQEGFETQPSAPWNSFDWDDSENGSYYWARRTCQSQSGDYSAWAVGGGAEGSALPCGASYPAYVDSWMAYGPFDLSDATAANLGFYLWLDVGNELGPDDLCILAASSADPAPPDLRYLEWNGACLTYQPAGWSPLSFHLDNNSPGINMLGQQNVWIAFNFVSDGAVSGGEGAYVDDVVIRKCTGGTCPTVVARPSTAHMWKAQRVLIRQGRRLPTEERPAK